MLLDLDVIASEEFAATNFPGSGGLSLEEVRQALSVFARQPTLAALVVAGYNPTRDTDAKAAKIVVDLLVTVLSPRLQAPPAESTGPSIERGIESGIESAGTLTSLRDKGCLLIGYTESLKFYTNYRVRNLQLDGLLHYLYSPPDHELPGHVPRLHPREHYELKSTIHKALARGAMKPNPEILLDIVAEVGAEVQECVYVGDSLMKDVFMAQRAGVTDVWAKYGVAQSRAEYELLRRVTHWTDEDVSKERKLTPEHINPTYILHQSFGELADEFDSRAFATRALRGPARLAI